MSNADPRGKFVWHELLTPDAVAAAAFYTKVVPWKTQPWEQDASYTMWVAKNGPVGGIAALGDSGAPHWLPYIGVADVAGTVGTARGLGANVLKEPTDLPSGGSYAVLADPQGARFAIHKSGSAYAGAPPPAAGDFMWHELATSDVKAAMGFYTKLFGWEVGPVNDMGSAGLYHLFLREGSEYGGMYANSNVGEPSWLCYISVDDAGKAVAAAKAAGGRVLNGPEEVPGGSWVAQILDKDGAPFAVIESKMAAAASPPPAAKPAKPKAPKAEKPATAAAAPAAAEPSAAVKPAAAKPAVVKPAAKPAAAKPAPATPAAKPAAARPAGKAPAKVARKAKKAPVKGKAAKGKAAKGKAAKKSVARGKGRVVAKKAPAKKSAAGKSAGKKKSAAKRAPARKKSASRAKAKKHR